ncbi:MAG: hypothetical protein Kow00120_22450 [Anaerolineae bacterium]
MRNFRHITRLAFALLFALALVACSGADTPPEDEDTTPAGEGFQVSTGPNIAVVAGEPITLRAAASGGELAGCTWTITVPAARFAEEDAGRVVGEECELTLPADFTVERTGLWTIELTAESAAGETATDPIDIRVTPDTVDLLILGYALIFAIGIGFIATLAWRARSLRREARTLAALIDEEERERA